MKNHCHHCEKTFEAKNKASVCPRCAKDKHAGAFGFCRRCREQYVASMREKCRSIGLDYDVLVAEERI